MDENVTNQSDAEAIAHVSEADDASDFENISEEEYYPAMCQKNDMQQFIDRPYVPTKNQLFNYNRCVKPRLYQVAVMAADKCSEEAICNFLGLAKNTFLLYKRWFPEFRNAITQGKLSLIERATKTLYKSAFGMKYKEVETTEMLSPDPDDPKKMILSGKRIKTTEKVVPPNVKALEMILVNQDPTNWKKNVPIAMAAQGNITVIDPNNEDMKRVLDRMKSYTLETLPESKTQLQQSVAVVASEPEDDDDNE